MAYVEANFLNDMMNFNNSILAGIIQDELKKVVKEVLADIYLANYSTILLENLLMEDLREIAAV